MNILFKTNQKFLILLLFLLIVLICFFLYRQIFEGKVKTKINYEVDADIVNPKFIKEKINKDYLEVLAKKASFINESEMFLEGEVKYTSNNFTLESDKVNFDKNNFDAYSNEKTSFFSEKVSIKSQGFTVGDKGDIISFKGKSSLIIE